MCIRDRVLAVVGIMAFPLTLAQYKERKIYKRFDATPLGKGAVIAVQGLSLIHI